MGVGDGGERGSDRGALDTQHNLLSIDLLIHYLFTENTCRKPPHGDNQEKYMCHHFRKNAGNKSVSQL